MLKLIKGELKKIFLKSGIFIVTALLVVALTISCFLFNPSKRTDNPVRIPGDSISQMYDASFGSSQSTNNLSKTYLNSKYINTSADIIVFYNSLLQNSSVSKKQELLNKVNSIKTGIYFDYKRKVINTAEDADVTAKDNLRNNLKQELEDFNSLYISYINGNNGFYYLLSSDNEKINFDVFLSSVLTRPFISGTTHSATINEIEESLDLFNTINSYINKMEDFIPSQKALEEAENYLDQSKNNLQLIENEIEKSKALSLTLNKSDNEDRKVLNELKAYFPKLITRYQQACENAYSLTKLTINYSALSKLSDSYIQSLYQFKDTDYKTKYTINEQKNICKYYLETNKYAFEYANPLSLEVASNSEANVYDFMYFALELCSFIILAYIIFIGATMITGEYASGTMKLLAIRPYSRRKILLSKLLATVFIGLLFLLISFIVTYIVGGILFSLTSMPILIVFNSTTVTSVNPIVAIVVLFLCKIIEIVFYAVFALFISTLLKSNASSVIISILTYFGSLVLAIFTPTVLVLKYLPFLNTNLFAYFGSHLSTTPSNMFSSLFGKVIANELNFFISLSIIVIFSALIYFITSLIFRKRDIK